MFEHKGIVIVMSAEKWMKYLMMTDFLFLFRTMIIRQWLISYRLTDKELAGVIQNKFTRVLFSVTASAIKVLAGVN